jgi:hypothetical protein
MLTALFISFAKGSQLITLLALGRPACLLPMSTVGTPRVGASAIPLEEFPTTALEQAINDRYFKWPSDSKYAALGLPKTKLFINEAISLLPESEFGRVKMIEVSFKSDIASKSSSI